MLPEDRAPQTLHYWLPPEQAKYRHSLALRAIGVSMVEIKPIMEHCARHIADRSKRPRDGGPAFGA